MNEPISKQQVQAWRKRMNKFLASETLAIQQVKEEKNYLKDSLAERYSIEQAQKILQDVAQAVQEQAHQQITRIVSKCLQMVFDEPYEFEIVFERKRGKTDAEMYLVRDGHRLEPKGSTGGGVVDIASFALRIACLSLRLPKGRSFIALDEPFKHVSADLRPRVAAMLVMLSEELGFQFLLSTHMKSLKLGTVHEIR
jgi:DNA repair exonuclease SbcCD ATPase subunit